MSDTSLEQVRFKVTPEALEDLVALEGAIIEALLVWDSSLVDEKLDEPVRDEDRMHVDCELYLTNQTLLELYGAAIFPDENSEPLRGMDAITQALDRLTAQGARLENVFMDEENDLILKLSGGRGSQLLLLIAAWIETTWNELPNA